MNYFAYELTDGTVAYGYAVAATCVSTADAVGVAEGTVAANIMYSKRNTYNSDSEYNTPRNNQAQNKQVDDICNELKLDKKQRRQLHDMITGEGYSYWEIYDIAREIVGK